MVKNIYLIGFMGSGKSSVGREVASLTNKQFIDCDQIIIEREGCDIIEIFKRRGEEYFRRVESVILDEISGRSGLCVATGGGIVKSDANIRTMKNTGFIFWLDVRPETVLKRLEKDRSRPLLLVEDRYGKINELILERRPLYSKAADYTIQTDEKDIKSIASEIIDCLTKDDRD